MKRQELTNLLTDALQHAHSRCGSVIRSDQVAAAAGHMTEYLAPKLGVRDPQPDSPKADGGNR